MFNVGPWELVLILVIVLLIFGPGKLPEVGRYLGKGIREFKKSMNALETEIKEEPAQKETAQKETASGEGEKKIPTQEAENKDRS